MRCGSMATTSRPPLAARERRALATGVGPLLDRPAEAAEAEAGDAGGRVGPADAEAGRHAGACAGLGRGLDAVGECLGVVGALLGELGGVAGHAVLPGDA